MRYVDEVREKYEIVVHTPQRSCNENNYQHLARDFWSSDCDFLVQIDDDNPPLGNPFPLVELDRDIIALPTPVWKYGYGQEHQVSGRPVIWNVFRFNNLTKAYRPILDGRGLERIDAAGAGCMIIAKRVFEHPNMQSEGWHRKWNPANGVQMVGLDIAFCERAKECGFELYCYWDITCDHFKELSLAKVLDGFNNWLIAMLEEHGGVLKIEDVYPDVRLPSAWVPEVGHTDKIGYVFPIWVKRPEHFEVVKDSYENLVKNSNGIKIYVPDDASAYKPAIDYFIREHESGRCQYMRFQERSGLTRSWNEAAGLAFREGAEVVVLSNQDAYPVNEVDLHQLVGDCELHRDIFFAVGPLTNNPGHVGLQGASERGNGLVKLYRINGFTWAIHKDNYKKAVGNRGRFLFDDHEKVFDMRSGAVVSCEAERNYTLAMVGQEDEIFHWANTTIDMSCGISKGSYFQHEKLALFRSQHA
jgi:GT2 family glycosyltransferase